MLPPSSTQTNINTVSPSHHSNPPQQPRNTEPKDCNLVQILNEDLTPRDNDAQLVFDDNHSSLSTDDYEHSIDDDELNYNSCDETLAILNNLDSPRKPGGPSEPPDAPLIQCCLAFWDLSAYCTLFATSFWISFVFLMLIQPTVTDIRREIADIDPISGQNHPILHRSRSDPFCSNYTLSELTQFCSLSVCVRRVSYML